MLGIFKKKKSGVITVTLNAKLQPQHRAEIEDAFDSVCESHKIGARVVGGGTLMEPDGEVKLCDIEVEMDDMTDQNIERISGIFASMLAPKGSYISAPERASPLMFGKQEGLGLYLNGTDLPDEVYASSSATHVYDECERLLEGIAMVNSHWQGPSETALYMYGESFEKIRHAIQPLLDSYPLCQKCRVVQIA